VSYRDGHYRARPRGYAFPLERPFATFADAWKWARIWVPAFGLLWIERDGVTEGHLSAPVGDRWTAHQHTEED
jgi:hypothetical protein